MSSILRRISTRSEKKVKKQTTELIKIYSNHCCVLQLGIL
jgi:hypothetical protein